MYRNRTKVYCRVNERDMDAIWTERESSYNHNYWWRPENNPQNSLGYADAEGNLQCGITQNYEEGTPEERQPCPHIDIDGHRHQINPCRTWIERAFLRFFELDHR